jgi:hypothetical protein
VKRKVTIVRLIATDNLGQRTIRKIRFLHR